MWLLTLLLLIFILGIIILVHEFGHFIWAKTFGVYIYEFSIGMGPIIYSHTGKDKIKYNLRAIPIGGFVSMAGEVYEDDNDVPKEKLLCNKKWYQRLIIMVAGVTNNFILAIILLFFGSLIWGGNALRPVVSEAVEGYPMYDAGIRAGDTILKINDHKVNSWDVAQIVLSMKNDKEYYTFEIKHEDGKIDTYKITPKTETNPDTNKESKVFGFKVAKEDTKNVWDSIKYSFNKFGSIVNSMWLTISGLFTGKISLNALSGPVGIYHVVGDTVNEGIDYIIYLIALLSINVGFINILPFPAFDGGHVLFLIIEKIKGSKVNAKIENIVHTIGFILILLLMIYITIQDIIRFF